MKKILFVIVAALLFAACAHTSAPAVDAVSVDSLADTLNVVVDSIAVDTL